MDVYILLRLPGNNLKARSNPFKEGLDLVRGKQSMKVD